MVYGRSSQGNKLNSQDPELVGPFHITPGLSWQECLGALAKTAEVPKESLPGGEGLKWRFQGKNSKLPLKDENGFLAMKVHLRSHKDPNSTTIVITLPTNIFNSHCKPQITPNTGANATSAVSKSNPYKGTLWGKKIGTHCLDYYE